MIRRLTVILTATLLACGLHAADRPNIILVMADDQGWGDTGYNGHPIVKTPTMDAMAKEGFVFDRFYAASPLCSPTRASVLTGRNPNRSKTLDHGNYMRPHEQTIAETLKANGYVTGMFGKSHVGSGQPDTACNPGGMGFDEWIIGLNFFDNDPYLSHNGTVKQRKGKGSVILMDDALGFLKKHKGGDKPIFTVIWFPSPHVPHKETPEGGKLYAGKKGAGYWNEITLLDQQLGRLRSELRDMGIADNTILWYCGDNGGLMKESSGGRAKKKSIYEGGLRVPGLLEWPARSVKGRSSIPVSTSDIYPTVLAMAGIPLPDNNPVLDGEDVSDIIFKGKKTRENGIGFWLGLGNGQPTLSDALLKDIMKKQQAGAPLPHNEWRMRKDVDDFKQYDENTTKGHSAWLEWPWKIHLTYKGDTELYNLEDDPMETTNLANTDEHHERASRMMKQGLRPWMASVIRSLNGEDYDKALSQP